MNDSSFPVPDVWGAINVYYAHIQSIKEFKDRYDGLMSEKEKFDIAKGKANYHHCFPYKSMLHS